MFRLRVVEGSNKGKYYQSFDGDSLTPKWCEDISEAAQLDTSDAVGVVIAAIDRLKIVLAAERMPETTDEQCQDFALNLTNNMFQNPQNETVDIVKMTIRCDANAPIFDQPNCPKTNANYMSVWEWLSKALAANNDSMAANNDSMAANNDSMAAKQPFSVWTKAFWVEQWIRVRIIFAFITNCFR